MLTMKIVEWKDDHYLWTAEVTTPQGIWRTPQPTHPRELNQMLLSMGVDKDEIFNARTKAFTEDAEITYRRLEKEYLPFLQAVLAGEREVPKQEPFAEGWLAYALLAHHTNEELRPLWEVLYSADAENHAIPTYDEISWAFLPQKEGMAGGRR
ncbi:MAG: hypothetical protein SA339_07000 [Methanomassiliicoccus sp.]|nr:hypothetical protein [Methanomassiliicoccus sp.]